MPRGRKPIGDRAMTEAERQRRCRARKARQEARDVTTAAARAVHALGELWSAVLHSAASVDATEQLRDDISRTEDVVRDVPDRLRALLPPENA